MTDDNETGWQRELRHAKYDRDDTMDAARAYIQELKQTRDQYERAEASEKAERARADQYERDAAEWMKQRDAALAQVERLRGALRLHGHDGAEAKCKACQIVAATDPKPAPGVADVAKLYAKYAKDTEPK